MTIAGDITVTGLSTWNAPSFSTGAENFTIEALEQTSSPMVDLRPVTLLRSDTLFVDRLMTIAGPSQIWQTYTATPNSVIGGTGSIINNGTIDAQNLQTLTVSIPVHQQR